MTALNKRLDTSTIAASSSGRALHYSAGPDRCVVSSQSRFGDSVWVLDILTPGQSLAAGTLRWDFFIDSNDLKFTAPQFNNLHDALKRFTWSLFSERVNGIPLSGGSVRKVYVGIKELVRWMHRNGYISLDELDAQASLDFIDDLTVRFCHIVQRIGDNLCVDEDQERGYEECKEIDVDLLSGRLRPRLQIWGHLWDQRPVMLRAGVQALPEQPFNGRSPRAIADQLGTKAQGWLPPVPDEVALPVMQEAQRWVDERADDICRLQEEYLNAHDDAEGLHEDTRGQHAKQVLTRFQFSNDPRTGKPWRGPVGVAKRLTLFNSEWRTANLGPHEVFRNLVEDLCAACVIMIQSEAGLRINEVCGLQASEQADRPLPANIVLRTSKTGLNEHFFLKGLLSKTLRVLQQVEWLIGSRPAVARVLPTPVRAVQVLDRLFAPLRKRAVDQALARNLILWFSAPRGYPRNGVQLARVQTQMLRKLQRQFIGNLVDLSHLPDRNVQGENLAAYRDSKGACLITHSWRKAFALYVFRTDQRMTDAIAQQFHHLSLAMTEEGYLGNDPTLLDVLDGIRQQQTARIFYELARGVRPMAGRLAKLVDKYRAELDQLLVGRDAEEGLEAIRQWTVAGDLRIWFSKHGKCFLSIAPSKARCHQLGGTAHWANQEPNFAFRTPDACLGCPVYAVDVDHAPFWLERYRENTRWLETEQATGGARVVAELRAHQSAAVLQAMGVDYQREDHSVS